MAYLFNFPKRSFEMHFQSYLHAAYWTCQNENILAVSCLIFLDKYSQLEHSSQEPVFSLLGGINQDVPDEDFVE